MTERATEGEPPRLTHIDETGAARMVDVGDKEATPRRAVADARLRMAPETATAIENRDVPKGDVTGTARIATRPRGDATRRSAHRISPAARSAR